MIEHAPSPGSHLTILATLSHKGRGKQASYAAIFTYSKSPGLLSIPTFGAAIQLAYLPGSLTGSINEAMKSPSDADGR